VLCIGCWSLLVQGFRFMSPGVPDGGGQLPGQPISTTAKFNTNFFAATASADATAAAALSCVYVHAMKHVLSLLLLQGLRFMSPGVNLGGGQLPGQAFFTKTQL
jgi:hypothetical protein